MADQLLPPVTAEAGQSKKLNILLINPNATKSMTQSCLASLQPVLSPDVILTGFTAPAPAPTAIESALDGVMSAAACIRALSSPSPTLADQPLAANYDGFLVACFSAHPLIDSLREEFDKPVLGIMEAALLSARVLGGRVGVVATSARSKVHAEEAVRNLGMDVAGVEHCGLGVLELERKGEDVVCGIMAGVGQKLVESGADVLVLGCAGMSSLKGVVEREVGDGVQVVDGVVAGVQLLSGLVRMGAKTAKRGVYRSSGDERNARGQNYL